MPTLPETPTETCTGGLPTATFPLTRVLVAGGKMTIPFELPTAVFSSIKLLSPAVMPMPKFLF